jgi:hypothetical protein
MSTAFPGATRGRRSDTSRPGRRDPARWNTRGRSSQPDRRPSPSRLSSARVLTQGRASGYRVALRAPCHDEPSSLLDRRGADGRAGETPGVESERRTRQDPVGRDSGLGVLTTGGGRTRPRSGATGSWRPEREEWASRLRRRTTPPGVGRAPRDPAVSGSSCHDGPSSPCAGNPGRGAASSRWTTRWSHR